ncbi:uncharacterized protein LOC117324610 [Pecten maximus]|uniref:uncharacterized protein LOC117324610 n=1 Tax=Pecten maximus TaxID=6579 RepID=UPI00145867A2|nr:uncharacterized protein LOC117324610 [Pecten maximus]
MDSAGMGVKNQTKVHANNKSLYKPYWNNELQVRWNSVCEKERRWLKCVDNQKSQKRQLKLEFCMERKGFDKLHRQIKRQFQATQVKELQKKLEQPNSRDFWRDIGKIGIVNERIAPIPLKVKDPDGNTVNDTNAVLERWRFDYESLYATDSEDSTSYNEEHFRTVKERIANDTVPIKHDFNISELNAPIQRQEIMDAICRAKIGKAAGIDSIPAEALKNDTCVDIMFSLISHCFTHGVVPDKWKQGIINPIVKPNSTEPGNPLTYRGITLLSVPCKVYCDILNRRLSSWLEKHNILHDAQNGFRKDRSCQDHVYSLYSVVKNRINAKKSTYSCFIDLRKAFDTVDRECLWNRHRRR